MKLAVFSDHGIGRYLAQLFDNIPEATFLSERARTHYDARKNSEALRSCLFTVHKQQTVGC